MTANTDKHEQLRLIFLEQVGHLITDGTIETRSLKRAGISFACGNLHAAFLAWQAAHRAPVVPVPQWGKVGTCEWHDGYADHTDGGGPYKERVLYTAPQPPEVECMTCNGYGAVGNPTNAEPCPDCTPRGHLAEAAPVLLPEPEANVHAKLGTVCMFSSTTMGRGDKIYTEQQMRGMLS